MKLPVYCAVALGLTALASAQPGKQSGRSQASVSYIVLQDAEKDSLIGISSEGKLVSTIANGAGGVALTADKDGNYIVAGKSRLLRVSPSGAVSTVATAPGGAQWNAVAAEPDGSFLVADVNAPGIWHVAPDGMVASEPEFQRIIRYPATILGLAVDEATGARSVLFDSGARFLRLLRQSGNGASVEVRLQGAELRSPAGFASDGSGGFLVTANVGLGVYRISPDGGVSRFADLPNTEGEAAALTRSAVGEIVVFAPYAQSLVRLNADGSRRDIISLPRSIQFFAAAVIPFPENKR